MIRVMNDVKQKIGATSIHLRDIDSNDIELRDFLIKEGLVKMEMPEAHTLHHLNWKNEEEYMMTRLSTKARWHFRRNILDKKDLFNVTVLSGIKNADEKRISEWQQLYRNVKDKSFNINTYELPDRYFTNILSNVNWEVIELRLKPDESKEELLVGVGFCYKSKNNYSIMAVGLNYDYVLSHGCYRQSLYQSVARANALKCDKLYLGMDASIEKQKFGVEMTQKSVFIQASDNFTMELIGAVYSQKEKITRQADLKAIKSSDNK
jgi:hypothetical protein